MSDISPISGSNPALAQIAARRAAKMPQVGKQPPAAGDSVQVSATARLLGQLKDVPEVRQDLIDRVRAEIAGGTYETDEKLDATVEAILDELA